MQLSDLEAEVRECQRCPLWKKSRCRVPGSGLAAADIMFVGQAPGIEEGKEGVPFIGLAGAFQGNLLSHIGIPDAKIYFTNLAKCFTGRGAGGDYLPSPETVAACEDYLKVEIEIVQPKVIVAIGAFVMRYFGIAGGIKQNSGKMFETEHGPVIPILHPAGIFRRYPEAPIYATQLRYIKTVLDGSPIPPPFANMEGEDELY